MKSKKSGQSELNGLVLIGGKSKRMGIDKASIKYHTQPQALHQAHMLAPFCKQTFLAVAHHDKENEYGSFNVIKDNFPDQGPLGALLSAFAFSPGSSWLTVACDLPYLESTALKQLIENRNPNKIATCFFNPESKLPEPLLTIWEPRARHLLQQELSKGNASPRTVLMNNDPELLNPRFPEQLSNVNTPEGKRIAEQFLKNNP